MKRTLVLTLAALLAVVAGAGPAAAAVPRPAIVHLEKSFDLGATIANGGVPTWTGTVSGAADGTLEVVLLSYRATGVVEHIRVELRVAAGERSLTIRGNGVFNNETNRFVLAGKVVDGWREGARVHEESTRTDAATSAWIGTLSIVGRGR